MQMANLDPNKIVEQFANSVELAAALNSIASPIASTEISVYKSFTQAGIDREIAADMTTNLFDQIFGIFISIIEKGTSNEKYYEKPSRSGEQN